MYTRTQWPRKLLHAVNRVNTWYLSSCHCVVSLQESTPDMPPFKNSDFTVDWVSYCTQTDYYLKIKTFTPSTNTHNLIQLKAAWKLQFVQQNLNHLAHGQHFRGCIVMSVVSRQHLWGYNFFFFLFSLDVWWQQNPMIPVIWSDNLQDMRLLICTKMGCWVHRDCRMNPRGGDPACSVVALNQNETLTQAIKDII